MTQTCSKCSRANPPEAIYCYFDGFVLEGHSRNGGPVAVGSQVFNSPFVFPDGLTCRSFDELALACQEHWRTARDLLEQGFFESFFAGIGRVDLVMAAREAKKFPDHDRGLDQLLGKVPSDVLQSPRLRVEPQEVNLGTLQPGQEREFELRMENRGMRLLYGTVSSESEWLALGEAPGAAVKHFEFTADLTLPVRVRGDRLRAGNKPLVGRLVVESSGGAEAVTVRCEVPVKPFPDGVLAGARTPRQVAEKARANPKEAAPYFESGAVAEWYKANGWVYPVPGPAASGMGAVQQFFEALGLTTPPKVEINKTALSFKAEPGQSLSETVEVKSQERRPVYAHGTSNQPWLEVSRAQLNGRYATITVSIPSVPNRPGETLRADLTVQSNGNQRFVLPVTLEVVGDPFAFGAPPVEEIAPVDEVEPVDEVVPVEEVASADAPALAAVDPAPVPAVAAAPALEALEAPAPAVPAPPPPSAKPSRRGPADRGPLPVWVHALPAGLLVLALLGIVTADLLSPKRTTGNGPGPDAGAGGLGDVSWTYDLADNEPRLGVSFNERMRFGLVTLRERDPRDPDKYKKLTGQPDGSSNNTCVMVDGSPHLFGQRPGTFVRGRSREPLPRPRIGYRSQWLSPENILVTQHVEVVPGEQSRVLDTCLIYYTVENRADLPHKVGLRFLLDTFIGANDGVPFVIPGQSGLLTTLREFGEKQVPDYIEALEKPDPNDPGTVAHIGLKGITLPGVEPEPITQMIICRWPGSEARWEPDQKLSMQPQNKDDVADSCVLLYWDYRMMAPGEKREMAFTYGLGKIEGVEGGQRLGLTAGGNLRPGGEFTVTAYVKKPRANQKVRLILPAGLSFVDNQAAELPVEVVAGQEYNQVSWRVRSERAGDYALVAESDGARASYTVKVKSKGIFD